LNEISAEPNIDRERKIVFSLLCFPSSILALLGIFSPEAFVEIGYFFKPLLWKILIPFFVIIEQSRAISLKSNKKLKAERYPSPEKRGIESGENPKGKRFKS
jgi:hypothetical protein